MTVADMVHAAAQGMANLMHEGKDFALSCCPHTAAATTPDVPTGVPVGSSATYRSVVPLRHASYSGAPGGHPSRTAHCRFARWQALSGHRRSRLP